MGNSPGAIVKTPNLDRLAAEGVKMTNCYCASPICVPSRSSMLTSTYPQDTGVLMNDNSLPSDWPSVAHSLGAAGYETVLSGRMHFIGADQRHGFEKRFVGDFVAGYPGGREKNHDLRWNDGSNFTYGPNRQSVAVSGAGSSAVLLYDDAVRDATIEFLEDRTDNRPLLLTVGFYSPHHPFVGPKKYYDYYYDKFIESGITEISDSYREKLHPTTRTQMNIMGLDDLTPEEIRRCSAAYCSMIHKMDEDIGTIIECVERTLDIENTIIIYASDHGEMLGSKGLFYKFAMYEGSTRVPMIVKWKEHIKPNREIKNITSLIDITPTLIEVAGATQLPLTRGISLYKHLLEDIDVDPERTVCSQILWNKLIFSGKQYTTKNMGTNYASAVSFGADEPEDGLMAMIRWHQYKLIFHRLSNDKDYELYDIEKDPDEDHDLSNYNEYQKICDNMAAELLKFWNPEEALEKALRDKANINILRKWYESHNRGLPEELWLPSKKYHYPINYLE